MRRLSIFTLSLLGVAVSAAEQLYVVVAPSLDAIGPAKASIILIEENKVSPVADLDVQAGISGMFLDKIRNLLIIYGDGTATPGYVSLYHLAPGFAKEIIALPLVPLLSVSLGTEPGDPDMFFRKAIIPGKSHDLFGVRFVSGKAERIEADKWPQDLASYAQAGPFAHYVNLTVDLASGSINYYAGSQEWPSSYQLPRQLLASVSSRIDHHGWVGFASDERVLAFKGNDKVSDKSYIYVYNKGSKKWFNKTIDGYRSELWANELGFAYTQVMKGADDPVSSTQEIILCSYDLEKTWTIHLDAPSEIIGWDHRRIVARSGDGIYLGYFEEGRTLVKPFFLAEDKSLGLSQAVFFMDASP